MVDNVSASVMQLIIGPKAGVGKRVVVKQSGRRLGFDSFESRLLRDILS